MNGKVHLNFPTNGFTFKPVVIKPKSIPNDYKPLTKLLYCVAHKNKENNWEAHINTKNIEGYEDVTILPFSEKSFELLNRNNVFYHIKDKDNHWTRIIRTDVEARVSPGNVETYCTLCENCIFSGHIVKINGIRQFNMSSYQGTIRECGYLVNHESIDNNEE